MYLFEFKDIDGALEFYRRVEARKAESLEERQNILVEMAREGYMKRVMETQRTQEEVASDWSEHHNVLYIKDKDNAIGFKKKNKNKQIDDR